MVLPVLISNYHTTKNTLFPTFDGSSTMAKGSMSFMSSFQCPWPRDLCLMSSILMLLPAICCARRIFCRLFQQHTEKITRSRNNTSEPRAIPTFAPAVRWGPHEGSPGMPQRPELSVKLHTKNYETCSWLSTKYLSETEIQACK